MPEYFFFLCGFLIFYFSGHLVYTLLSTTIPWLYSRVFAKTLIGLILVVLIYSLVKASFNTINIVIIPIIIFILLSKDYKFTLASIKKNKSINEDEQAIIPILLLLTTIFAYQYYSVCITTNGFPAITNSDELFNAHLAMYLNHTGVETLNWNYLSNSTSVSPYHYFICWIISFLSTTFHNNTYLTTELWVNPFLYCLTIIGMWAIVEKYTINVYAKLMCCLILFMGGIHITAMDKHALFNWSYFYFNIFEPDAKLTLYYIIVIASLLLWQNNKYTIALLVFLLLPVFSIVLAPSVVIACIILILFYSIKERRSIRLLIYPLIIAASILLFYKLFCKEQMLSIPSVSLNSSAAFLFAFKTFIYKCTVALIVYSPYIVVLLYSFMHIGTSKLKVASNAIGFILIGFIVSFSVWMVLYNYYGAIEFHYYFITPVINVLVFTMLLYAYAEVKKRGVKIIFLVIILPALIFSALNSLATKSRLKNEYQNKYSATYLSAIKHEVGSENCLLVATTERDGIYEFTGNPFVPGSSTYLSTMTECNSIIRLNYDTTNQQKDKYKQAMESFNPLAKFIAGQKVNGSYKNRKQSEFDFMKSNNIKYLLLGPGQHPAPLFTPYIYKTITDNISGESLIVFQFNNWSPS